MYTLLILGGGRQVDALLLSASAERLRVVMPGRSDTSEFRLIEGRWTSESGDHVDVGAILAGDVAEAKWVLGNAQGRTRAAG
jgi:hypothetical protein